MLPVRYINYSRKDNTATSVDADEVINKLADTHKQHVGTTFRRIRSRNLHKYRKRKKREILKHVGIECWWYNKRNRGIKPKRKKGRKEEKKGGVPGGERRL